MLALLNSLTSRNRRSFIRVDLTTALLNVEIETYPETLRQVLSTVALNISATGIGVLSKTSIDYTHSNLVAVSFRLGNRKFSDLGYVVWSNKGYSDLGVSFYTYGIDFMTKYNTVLRERLKAVYKLQQIVDKKLKLAPMYERQINSDREYMELVSFLKMGTDIYGLK